MPGFFDPLMPQSWIDPLQKRLEQRSLDQTPEDAALKGFGSGALEGLRGLTSPANLMSMIPTAGMGAKLASMAPKMARMAGPAMQVLDEVPAIRQAMPAMDEVGELVSSMKNTLSKVPQAGAKVKLREFMPVDEMAEPLQGLKRAADPYADEMYRKYITNKVR